MDEDVLTSEEEDLEETQTPEETVPAAVVGGLRRELREKEQKIAELEAAQQKPEPDEELSPVEKLAEEDPYAIPDAQTLRAQRQWEAKQSQKTQERQQLEQQKSAAEKSRELAEQEYAPEKVGKGLDFESVLELGQKHLTQGDLADMRANPERAMQIAYEQCLYRIAKSGGPDAKILKARQEAVSAKKTEPTKPADTEREEPEGAYAGILNHIFGNDEETE